MSFSIIHTPLQAPSFFGSVSDYPELCVVLTCDRDVPEASFVLVLLKRSPIFPSHAFNLASSAEINRGASFEDIYIEAHNLAVSLDIPFINHHPETVAL